MNNNLKKKLFMGIIFLIFVVGGWFYSLLGYFIPACMLFGLGIAVSRGRSWCNWYCPRGSFFDSFLGLISPKKEIPSLLKKMNFRIIVLSFLMAIMIYQITKNWGDIYAIGKFFLIMLTSTTIIGFVLALIFHQRSWCYICPIGTLSNIIGRDKYPLKIDSEKCVSCKICNKACPMQIEPYNSENYDCIKCSSCIDSCPKKALYF